MFCEYKLTGTNLTELDTEIRFNVANARQERAELIRMIIAAPKDDGDLKRLTNCFLKVARSMVKSDHLQFFINEEDVHSSSTEAEFLLNKYSDLILPSPDGVVSFLLKL